MLFLLKVNRFGTGLNLIPIADIPKALYSLLEGTETFSVLSEGSEALAVLADVGILLVALSEATETLAPLTEI